MQLKDYLHYYLYGNIYEVGVGTRQLIGIGDCYYTIKTKQGNLLTLSDRADIKLVLRRLEDMTEEERVEIFGTDTHWYKPFDATDACDSRQWHKLLSKHFDLFSLIPAGLAIDIKTL